MIPIKTIIIYKSNGPQSNKEFYIESANLVKSGEKYIPIEPKPITISELKIFSNAYKGANDSSRIKESSQLNIIYSNISELIQQGVDKDNLFLIWHTPPQKRNMYFPEDNSIKTGTYNIPGIVWKYEDGGLSVYSYFDKYINMRTDLYKSPFMNIYANNSVCLGNTVFSFTGIDTINKAKEMLESGFYNSMFNHFHSVPFTIEPQKAYERMKEKQLIKKLLKKEDLQLKDICP